MSTLAIDSRLKLQLFLWYGVLSLGVLLLGVFLASDLYFIAFVTAGTLWLIALPYHAQLSLRVGMATYGSALIVPFLSARPYIWEMASLLGWTGAVMVIMLRRHPADLGQTIRRNKWIFIGAAWYCVVLLATMKARGVGFRIFGSAQLGGRFYFQQLVCSIFPFLFAVCHLEEKTFVRLFALQCLLAGTYIISDMAYIRGGSVSGYILAFFEVPGDAVNFEQQAESFGIRRFQSLAITGQALIYLLLIFNSLRDFIGRKSVWLVPVALAVLAAMLLGGHRMAFIGLGAILAIFAYAQRFLRPRNLVASGAVLAVVLMFTYALSDRLPQAGQRALSFLPGLEVDSQVALDASGTWGIRQEMFQIGWNMIPQYFWLGRGFSSGAYGEDFSAYRFSPTLAAHVAMGRFYNGFIGLMVNTGVFGFIGMTIFIIGGLLLALRIIRHVRRYGADDNPSRVAALVAGIYIYSVIAFYFLHGDSEFAMKSFALQSGMMIMAERLLARRVAEGVA